jgi:hypothetical protein
VAEGGAVLIDQCLRHAQQRADVGQVFQTADRRLRGEITAGSQPVLRQPERRVDAQARGVVAILVTGGDHHYPKSDHVGEAVHDLLLRARIVDAARQPLGHAKPLLDLPQYQNAGIRRQHPAIKTRLDRLARNR